MSVGDINTNFEGWKPEIVTFLYVLGLFVGLISGCLNRNILPENTQDVPLRRCNYVAINST